MVGLTEGKHQKISVGGKIVVALARKWYDDLQVLEARQCEWT